jgi:hypothetical protein
MLLTYRLGIKIPFAFSEGVDCFAFSSSQELLSTIRFLDKNPDIVLKTALSGLNKLKRFHTSHQRAKYFTRLVLISLKRDRGLTRNSFALLNFLHRMKLFKRIRKFRVFYFSRGPNLISGILREILNRIAR